MMNTNLEICVEMVRCAIKITVTQVLLISFINVFTKERVSVAMKVHDFVYIFYLLSIPV